MFIYSVGDTLGGGKVGSSVARKNGHSLYISEHIEKDQAFTGFSDRGGQGVS